MTRNHFKITFIPIILAGTILATACEKIIDIEIPDNERKIVVNGIISEDQTAAVNLSRSLTVLEADEFVFIYDAAVRLFQGDRLVGQFTADKNGTYFLPDFKPLAGNTYRLTVDYPGLNPVEAETTVPDMVPMTTCDTLVIESEWGYRDYRIKIVFNDPAGKDNYYGLSVHITYEEIDYVTMEPTGNIVTRLVYIYSDSDMFVEDESHNYGGKIYFDDLLFEGQSKSVEVGLYDYIMSMVDSVKIEVHLEQLDPAFYKYVVSNEAYQQAHNNPFAEPVQVYTNIHGGLGIFSSYSYSSRSFTLPGSRIGR